MDEAQTPAEPQAENDEAPPQKIKAMRRQPCPCGSGKVFKNCHEGDPGYEVATDAASATAAPPAKPGAASKTPAHLGFQNQKQQFNAPARNTGAPHRRKV